MPPAQLLQLQVLLPLLLVLLVLSCSIWNRAEDESQCPYINKQATLLLQERCVHQAAVKVFSQKHLHLKRHTLSPQYCWTFSIILLRSYGFSK